MKFRKTFMVAIALTALVAAPAMALPSADSDKDATDEWNIQPADYWAESIDASDEQVVGYVAMVDYPRFKLRTHDAGTMAFAIPSNTEYADDLRVGQRIQVWYNEDDEMTDASGSSWLILHGFGVHVDDMDEAKTADMTPNSVRDAGVMEKAERKKPWAADTSVRSTGLPTSSKGGPGPMAYTLTGTITEVNDSSIMLDTVVGPRIVRIVDATQNKANLETGNDVRVQFHRGGTLIHAKVIENAPTKSWSNESDTR